jgi:hypothetical protein
LALDDVVGKEYHIDFPSSPFSGINIVRESGTFNLWSLAEKFGDTRQYFRACKMPFPALIDVGPVPLDFA